MRALFAVDGVSFAVGVESLKRGADIADGENGGMMLNGVRKRDICGVYYNYTLTLSTDGIQMEQYDLLYEVLTSPAESHVVTLPYGQESITFDASIESISDELLSAAEAEKQVWGNLCLTFTAMQPYRKA